MAVVEEEQRSEREREFEDEALAHLDALLGFALRLTGGNEARSHDLVQETMLKAYRSWDTFEQGTNCRAWLMTILRNTFINEFRKKKSRPDRVEYDDIAETSVFRELKDRDPEGEFFHHIVDDEVVEAIEGLPDEYRVPLVLSDLEGLPYQEIAETMDIPLGTVKSRLFRARRKLQDELYEYAVEMGYIR